MWWRKMRLTIVFLENLATLDVADDMELENFMALLRCEFEELAQVEERANLAFAAGEVKVLVDAASLKKTLQVGACAHSSLVVV